MRCQCAHRAARAGLFKGLGWAAEEPEHESLSEERQREVRIRVHVALSLNKSFLLNGSVGKVGRLTELVPNL